MCVALNMMINKYFVFVAILLLVFVLICMNVCIDLCSQLHGVLLVFVSTVAIDVC